MSFDDDNRDADFRKLPAEHVRHRWQRSSAQVLGRAVPDLAGRSLERRGLALRVIDCGDEADDEAIGDGKQ